MNGREKFNIFPPGVLRKRELSGKRIWQVGLGLKYPFVRCEVYASGAEC